MQGPVRFHHRKFFRRSHDTTLRHARARRPRPTTRRIAGGPRRLGPALPGPVTRRGTGRADAVNCPTTRHASPAAKLRTGRGSAALPNDPGLEALLADKSLSAAAKLVATVLVKHWAWYKPSCY